MTQNLYIEDTQTGKIRVHKRVRENIKQHAAYVGEIVGAIETKKDLGQAIVSALSGAAWAEIDKLAEDVRRDIERRKK